MKIFHAITGEALPGTVGSVYERRYFSLFPLAGRLPKYYRAILTAEEKAFDLAKEQGIPYEPEATTSLMQWIMYYQSEMDKKNPVACFFYSREEYDMYVSKGIW